MHLAGIVNLVIDAGVKKYRQAGADPWGGEKREAASRISPFVDGYYMMTPFQRVELVCRVICETRNLAE